MSLSELPGRSACKYGLSAAAQKINRGYGPRPPAPDLSPRADMFVRLYGRKGREELDKPDSYAARVRISRTCYLVRRRRGPLFECPR